MGRIRSIHPSQWTDENFVECSFAARLLAIGIRNESDDNGIFEWKPVGLKMKLFPADAVDMASLLVELMKANQICQYELDGRVYGAVRNFKVYQSPKSPNFLFPVTAEILEYVGEQSLDGDKKKSRGRPRLNQIKSENEFPQKGEIKSVEPIYLIEKRENKGLKSDSETIGANNNSAKTPINSESDKRTNVTGVKSKSVVKQGVSDNEFPLNGEIKSDKHISFPQNGEFNSQRERRGGDNIYNNHITTDSATVKIEKAKKRYDPGTDPNLAKVMIASGMIEIPKDWKIKLDEWRDAGADLDLHIVPAIKTQAERNRLSGGKTAFSLQFFDASVRQKIAEDQGETNQWKQGQAHNKRIAEEQKKADKQEIDDDLALLKSWESHPPDSPGYPTALAAKYAKIAATG